MKQYLSFFMKDNVITNPNFAHTMT